MNTIIFICIFYYIFSGLIGIGRFHGEHFKITDQIFGFIFGFIALPLMLGKYIQRHL